MTAALALEPRVENGNERRWSAAEDAAIRARYPEVGGDLAADLGRPLLSLYERASRLGVSVEPRWTPADDRRLTMIWGEATLNVIAKRMGRTPVSVYWRASKIGLRCGCPQGMEYITNAARRTGFAVDTFKRIIAWAGVKASKTMSRPGARYFRCLVVEPDDADDAVKRWLDAETIDEAARRIGVDKGTMARWLLASGRELPPRPAVGCHWRVPIEVIDAVVAERELRESVMAGAKRHQIGRDNLARLLRAAGVRRPRSHYWFVEKTVIDDVVARYRAKGAST